MEPEESSCAELPEKVGLKRKLTGPPRLLLGKTKSTAQDEKKSDTQALRKQRRDKNNDMVEKHQGNNLAGCESQVQCRSPQITFTSEEGTCTDFQEEPLEAASASEQSQVKGRHGKSRLRRSRAKATIRRVFSPAFMCVRRRKPLDITPEDAEDNATHGAQNNVRELLVLSGDSFNSTERCEADLLKKNGRGRKFHMRILPIFKRFSKKSTDQKRSTGQNDDTFFEIPSEKSVERSNSAADQSDYCAPEPSGDEAIAEQLKGSSRIQENMAGIHEESCSLGEVESEKEASEMVEVSVDLDSHGKMESGHSLEQDAYRYHLPNDEDGENPKIQITEMAELGGITATHLNKSDVAAKAGTSAYVALDNALVVNDLEKLEPVENKVCRPVITIEDVHSSDEENHEPMESDVQQPNTLSPLVWVNGACRRGKVNRTMDHSNSNSSCSEILLVQTAFSLVHAVITAAVEQLSSELQSNQTDQDHA